MGERLFGLSAIVDGSCSTAAKQRRNSYAFGGSRARTLVGQGHQLMMASVLQQTVLHPQRRNCAIAPQSLLDLMHIGRGPRCASK